MTASSREPRHTGLPASGTSGDDLPGALRAIEDIGRWATAIDAKAALVAGMAGTVVAGLLSQAGLIHRTWRQAASGVPLAAVLLAMTLVALVAALADLAVAVLPRVAPFTRSRFSYPWLAMSTLDTVTAAPRRPSRDAWEHARLLARLNVEKLGHLRRAVCTTTAAVTLFVVWFVTLAASTVA